MTNAVNIASLGSPLSADANGYLTLTPSSSKIFGGGSTAGRMVLSNNDGTTYLIAYGSAYGGTQSSTLSFVTNTNKVTTMNANGNLVLNGGTFTAGGTGVTFPASQDASSDANCLDDYEEGTWSPSVIGSPANLTTPSIGNGRYTKVGNVVTLTAAISATITSTNSETNLNMSLPFAATSGGWNASGAFSGYAGTGPNRFIPGTFFNGSGSSVSTVLYIPGVLINTTGALTGMMTFIYHAA